MIEGVKFMDAEDVLYSLDIIRDVVLCYRETGNCDNDSVEDAINRLLSIQCDLESLQDNN